MAKAIQKITLSLSRDIPFDKLVLSQSNVRRIKAGVSVEELAEDIARRGLLQGLNVRPVIDADGADTGIFEIPAGGRRYRALQLLVKQKRLAKNASIPCIVREPGDGSSAEEDSLAENVQRVELHPLDQFRAFKALADQGLRDEDIGARFFASAAVVRQRLRLAAVSPKLLEVYAEDGMTLQQLMAFTVTNDHERQERVWQALVHSYGKEPYAIRRQLTDGAVRAADRRAQFVGVDTYEEAGGAMLRDLFEADDGGWLQDVGLLDRLATNKLQREAESITAEGWKWVEVGIDFPYGHTAGLRHLTGEVVPLTDEEIAARDALRAEFDRLEEEYAEADELPEGVDERLAELEAALEAFETRPAHYELVDIARGGAFVSIDHDGRLRAERGFVRPEDEPAALADEDRPDGEAGEGRNVGPASPTPGDRSGAQVDGDGDEEESDVLRPLSDRLVAELTTHRTLAFRDALAAEPQVAFEAVCCTCCASPPSIRAAPATVASRSWLGNRTLPHSRRASPKRRRRERLRTGISNGPLSCRTILSTCGRCWMPSIPTAVRSCSRIAPGLPST